MESISRLVSESLARHGLETSPDHSRLRWTDWFPCTDSLSALFVPSQPGLLALGEQIVAPGATSALYGKRMIALFRLVESEDLGMTLGRLLLKGGPECERLTSASCFARYTLIDEVAQRHSALKAFQSWMTGSVGPTAEPTSRALRLIADNEFELRSA